MWRPWEASEVSEPIPMNVNNDDEAPYRYHQKYLALVPFPFGAGQSVIQNDRTLGLTLRNARWFESSWGNFLMKFRQVYGTGAHPAS
ncbi:hypothetical protein ANN_10692 [Periplaneta americana]|uniref:Uncharacterized protein n=1 Tax=Periplaneta americana TaxID=6978 RepID=A0ABQ8T2Z1_PERAM|nr:hypothetical protein ANN_10692 [Periplaneta americana]